MLNKVIMDKPLISIIIPVYNRSKTIQRAIDSVLSQTLDNFDLIIVDDCSTDNSMEIVDSYQDPRIRKFTLNKNSGAAAARNEGIKNSFSEFISFLDSDDKFEPEFLEESLNVLKNTSSEIGFMWTGSRLIYSTSGKILEQQWNPKRATTSHLTFLKDLKIGTGAGISVKKEVFENCGYFDDSLPAAEDTEFFLRITEKYDYAVSLKILINIYRENSDRLSKNFVKIANAYNQFLPNHFAEIDQHPEIMVRYYYKMMWLNYHLKDKIKAKYYYDKIPKELRTSRIMAVKYLYELFPLTSAFYFHEKLAG